MKNEVIEVESIPTKIKYKGIIWVPETKNQKTIEEIPKKKTKTVDNINNNFTIPVEKRGNVKKPYIVRWIEKKDPGDVFTLDQFYRLYPKLKKGHGRKRVDKIIISLVQEGKINHWKHKGEFRVLK